MGNDHGKTETYRSKSLSKIFSGKNLDKSFFQQNKRRQGSNLRKKKQSIKVNRQSTPQLFIPQQRTPSPSFTIARRSIEEINTLKILNHQKKDQVDEVKKAVHFCQDFFQQFLCNNINNCANNESNFLNWSQDSQIDINPNINLLSRKFSKKKIKKKNFDKFLNELFRKEYQYVVEQFQQNNVEQQISKSSNSIELTEQKDLFPFLNKKTVKSRSISASSNERDFKPNSFRILNGHVFSFQTELQKQKQEKIQEIQQEKPELIQEVSEEESSLQQIQPFEELDLISQQKLNKFINKPVQKKEIIQKKSDLFEDEKYQALLEKEKELEQETQPMRVQIDLNKLKKKANKIEMEEPRLIDQIFHNSTQNSLKEIQIKPKKFNKPKKNNSQNKKNNFYSQKINQKQKSQFQQNFPSYQQSYKNKIFNPEKYLKGEQTIQPFIKPQTKKPTKKKQVNILQRFRESGKKRKNESLKSLHQEDSIEFEQQSIESDLYRDILKDFKSGYNKQDSLNQGVAKVFTKKSSQKNNKISIDISNLSKRMQNNFKN